MAVQNPFFGKREPEPFQRHTTPANGLNTLAPGSAPAVAAPAGGLTGQKPQASSVGDSSGSKLTVGTNIKLKGVEITDSDTLVFEGTVEATIDSAAADLGAAGLATGCADAAPWPEAAPSTDDGDVLRGWNGSVSRLPKKGFCTAIGSP